MFWIPDFAAAAADLLAADPTADPAISARVEFLRSLAAGEPPDPDASWPLDLVVDEPERGLTTDPAAVADLLGASARWQEQRKTKARVLDWIKVGRRAVVEAELELDHPRGPGERVPQPVAAVIEHSGRRVEVRVHASSWPLTGSNRMRPARLAGGVALPADSVGAYFSALAAADADAVVACFSQDASFREPSGGPYIHHGRDDIGPFFAAFLGAVGGIGVDVCTVVDDGVRCAVEYNALSWGDFRLTPQPGLGVYHRGPDGALDAVRVYDDIVGG